VSRRERLIVDLVLMLAMAVSIHAPAESDAKFESMRACAVLSVRAPARGATWIGFDARKACTPVSMHAPVRE